MKPCRIALFSFILLSSCGGEPSSSSSINPSSESSTQPSTSSSSTPSSTSQTPSSSSASSEENPSLALVREALERFNAKGFSTKGYEVSYAESYAAVTSNDNEEEESSMSLEYSCVGSKKVSYAIENDSEDKASYSPIEILSGGTGGYSLAQRELFHYINTVTDKASGTTTIDDTQVSQSHTLSVYFDETDFMASTEEFYNATSTGRTPQGYAHQYAGAIAKDILLDCLSNNLIENSLAKIKYADATNYVDQVEAHFMEMMPMLAQMDKDSLNEFLLRYDVFAEKQGEKIAISLNYAVDNLLEDEIDGSVPAELLFDENGDIESFDYDFSNLIRSLDSEDIDIDEDSTSFVVTGRLIRSTLDPIWASFDREYDDPIDYINDFQLYAFPRYLD